MTLVWSMDGGATWQTRTFPIGHRRPGGVTRSGSLGSHLEDGGRIVMAITAGDQRIVHLGE